MCIFRKHHNWANMCNKVALPLMNPQHQKSSRCVEHTRNQYRQNWSFIICKCKGAHQVVGNKKYDFHMASSSLWIFRLDQRNWEDPQAMPPGKWLQQTACEKAKLKEKTELSWAVFLIFLTKPLLWCTSNPPHTEANFSFSHILHDRGRGCHGRTMITDRLSAASPTWQVAEFVFCPTHCPLPHDCCQSAWKVRGVLTSWGQHDTGSTSPANDQQLCGIHLNALPWTPSHQKFGMQKLAFPIKGGPWHAQWTRGSLVWRQNWFWTYSTGSLPSSNRVPPLPRWSKIQAQLHWESTCPLRMLAAAFHPRSVVVRFVQKKQAALNMRICFSNTSWF